MQTVLTPSLCYYCSLPTGADRARAPAQPHESDHFRQFDRVRDAGGHLLWAKAAAQAPFCTQDGAGGSSFSTQRLLWRTDVCLHTALCCRL